MSKHKSQSQNHNTTPYGWDVAEPGPEQLAPEQEPELREMWSEEDHRGYWCAGCVTADDTLDTLKALANEMIEEAIDNAAQNDDFEDMDGELEDKATQPWTVVWYDPDRNGGQIVVEEANTRRAEDAPADAGMPPGCDFVVFEGLPEIAFAAPIGE